MKRTISFLLCLVLLLGCMSAALVPASAVTGSAYMYNGFNTTTEVNNSGILSLAGSGATKTQDTKDKAEGTGSLFINMPATSSSFVSPFAFYTDLDSSYVTLADYDYLEILYKSDVTLTGDYRVQVRLADKAVSVAGSGYEYEVTADLTAGKWNKAVFDLSNPYYTLAGMQGKFNRIRLVMINKTGSFKEIDIRFDGILLYTEEYKTARDAELAVAWEKINALPTPTEDNLDEMKTKLDELATVMNSEYQNFVPSNFSDYLTKKDAYEKLSAGIDPNKSEVLTYAGFDSESEVKATGVLSLGGNSSKSFDALTKYDGAGSMRIDMPATHSSYLKPYAYYFDIDHDYIDKTKYQYVETVYKTDKAHVGEFKMQLHLIDTAVSTAGSGYDYDAGVTLDGNWNRWTMNLASPYNTIAGIGNQINRVRYIVLNYTGAYQELDMNVDSVVFFNQVYADARTAAEQEVALILNEIPEVTESNYEYLADQFEAADAALAEGQANFVNFMPGNYSAYAAKKAKYDAYVNGTGVANAFAMPNFFANGMMFQRNKTINLFGVSTTDKTIDAELYIGTSTTPIETVRTTVPVTGEWALSFDAREGSYDAYRIVVYEDSVVKKEITDVVVGELWLAAGQSNMEYRLDWELNGQAEMAALSDPYLRMLQMNGNPVGTSGPAISSPTFDLAGAHWINASTGTNISLMSANGYYAAKQLRKGLDMPVGIINAALGSTNIQTWLSRESIESNEVVKTSLQNKNLYRTESQCATTPSDYRHMTAMFNTKVGPLGGLNLGGVFWCQGESNRDGSPNNYGFYCQAIQALASGYSKIFGFENGDMPVMVINIANHPYLNDAQNIPKWIEEIADAQEANPNIVNIPIYDVQLTYVNPPAPGVAAAIHPNTKGPGGTRAGLAALYNFCTDGEADYYAPTVESYEVKDGAIYVTFNHTVDGLSTLDDSIGVHGFTIAGSDGQFLPAYATIESENVVKVWNDSIEEPENFTYAFNSHAQTANLCNSYDLPAIPYRSNRDMTNYFASNDWLYCDDTQVFVNEGGSTSGYRTTWQGAGSGDVYGVVSVDNNSRHEGTGSIKVNYMTNSKATAGASVYYGQYLMPFYLYRYKTISIMVRNDDARDKTMRFLIGSQDGEEMWMLPVADASGSYEVTLKGGSDFTCYTFAIQDLKGYNTDAAISWSSINRIDVLVEDTATGSIHIDDVMVGSAPAPVAPFVKWDESLNPIYHVGLSTATSADTNWNNYNYIGQEFVPATDGIYGVQLPLNLTSGKATVHMEIRSTVNGTALAQTDYEIESKGDGVNWYSVYFNDKVSLKANRAYYLVYYLTAREASSVCIAYGTDLGPNNATHYGYAWPMANGGTPNLTSLSNQLQFGFSLLTEQDPAKVEADKAAAQVVINQINALPDPIALTDEAAVKDAREAYENLTNAQKEWVINTNLAKLEKAEADIEALKTPAIPYGDVNRDNAVDAKDALMILQAAVDKIALTEEQRVIANVSGDAVIDAKDALFVLQKAVDKIDKFPVEQ